MIAGAFLSAACVFELFRGFENMDIHPSKPVAYGALVLLYVLHIVRNHFDDKEELSKALQEKN